MPNSSLKIARLVLWAMIFGLVGMGTFAKRGIMDWKRIARRNFELSATIEKAKEQKQSLERQVEALQFNSAEQERVVRHTLGYVRPQELVVEFH